ncbi:ribosomal RNA small subunit methyltransferase A [candidate division WWE3 bacterium]|nr:ribosomal RNA small subunit methyltransferase A [candidate division WWE3 bacterium]
MKTVRELGQNFLVDYSTRDLLVESANLTTKDTVLEIGPGTGVVTEAIAKKCGKLIAVELDPSFSKELKNRFRPFKNVKIVTADGLRYLKENAKNSGVNKIVASIPFQITSPLLHKIAENNETITLSSLLIQKEVAQRITSLEPDSNYLSIFMNTFLDTKIVSFIDKTAFDPVPTVDGAIILLKTKPVSLLDSKEIKPYSRFLHHGFGQQRKMINKRFHKNSLSKAGIDPSRRPQTLAVREWLNLYAASKESRQSRL